MAGKLAPVRLALIGVALSGCSIERYGEAANYASFVRDPIDVIMPANAPYISQQFAAKGKNAEGGHFGIDVWARVGTPIIAAAPGTVVGSFYEAMYGNRVVIDHGPDETGMRVTTTYKHMDTRLVGEGQSIARGQEVGTLGRTGLLAALPHLHFEVHRDTRFRGMQPLDPHLFWMNGVGRVTCFEPGTGQADTPFQATYPLRCKRS